MTGGMSEGGEGEVGALLRSTSVIDTSGAR